MLEYIRAHHSDVLETIASSGKLEDDTDQKLRAALDTFAGMFQPASGGERAA